MWGTKASKERREICYLHQSESSLKTLSVEFRRYTLHIIFLYQMLVQTDAHGEFCKEDANKVFLTLRSVLSCEEEVRRLPRGRVLFLSRMSKGSEVFPTSGDYLAVAWRTLYRLVRVSVHDGLILKRRLTKQTYRSLLPWTPKLKCLIHVVSIARSRQEVLFSENGNFAGMCSL